MGHGQSDKQAGNQSRPRYLPVAVGCQETWRTGFRSEPSQTLLESFQRLLRLCSGQIIPGISQKYHWKREREIEEEEEEEEREDITVQNDWVSGAQVLCLTIEHGLWRHLWFLRSIALVRGDLHTR